MAFVDQANKQLVLAQGTPAANNHYTFTSSVVASTGTTSMKGYREGGKLTVPHSEVYRSMQCAPASEKGACRLQTEH